jgi:glycosyltransferase involved in cell wall biosynthesis
MQPLVSILIPAYNSQEWISETIQSALAQTWPRREIIIVDDGSTDHTLQVAKQFSSKEVSVVTKKNSGAAATRNHALSLSQGAFIQWLDADDLLSPDKIERQLHALADFSDSRTLLSSSWGTFIYRPSRARFITTDLWCDLDPVEWLIRKFGQNLSMQTSVWLVSRELTEAAGPWNTRLLGDDDGEYFCRVALASKRIKFVPEAKVFYRRVMGGGLSYIGMSRSKLEAQLLALKLYVQHIRAVEDSPRVRRACLQMLQDWLPAFHPEHDDMVQQIQGLAAELGGSLMTPRLSWKYAWVESLLGRKGAKRLQMNYNVRKSSFLRMWDATMARFERSTRS